MTHVQATISPIQHGFMPRIYVITNLTESTHFVESTLDQNIQIDAIYIRSQKAFHLVNHDILLSKLDNLIFPTICLSLSQHI